MQSTYYDDPCPHEPREAGERLGPGERRSMDDSRLGNSAAWLDDTDAEEEL
jgi:hypothetical protein